MHVGTCSPPTGSFSVFPETLFLSPSTTWPHHSVRAVLIWTYLTSPFWLPHWPHRKLSWLCCHLLHSCYCPDQSISQLLPHDPWDCSWEVRGGSYTWETIAVLLGTAHSTSVRIATVTYFHSLWLEHSRVPNFPLEFPFLHVHVHRSLVDQQEHGNKV